MAGRAGWKMSGGETLDLAKSLRGDMGSGDTLTGETPSVTVWQNVSGTWTDVTASAGFTAGSVAVNTSELTDERGNTVAVGDAVEFRLTAGDPGNYRVRISCPSQNGATPASEVPLTVGQTSTPS